jgi:hypothetical protein
MARAIVLALHGGQARSPTGATALAVELSPDDLFARLLHHCEGEHGISVRILRYRYHRG